MRGIDWKEIPKRSEKCYKPLLSGHQQQMERFLRPPLGRNAMMPWKGDNKLPAGLVVLT